MQTGKNNSCQSLHLFRRYFFVLATTWVTLLALLVPLLHLTPPSSTHAYNSYRISPLTVPVHQLASFRTLFFVNRRLRLPLKRVRGRPTSAVIRLISSSSQGISWKKQVPGAEKDGRDSVESWRTTWEKMKKTTMALAPTARI